VINKNLRVELKKDFINRLETLLDDKNFSADDPSVRCLVAEATQNVKRIWQEFYGYVVYAQKKAPKFFASSKWERWQEKQLNRLQKENIILFIYQGPETNNIDELVKLLKKENGDLISSNLKKYAIKYVINQKLLVELVEGNNSDFTKYFINEFETLLDDENFSAEDPSVRLLVAEATQNLKRICQESFRYEMYLYNKHQQEELIEGREEKMNQLKEQYKITDENSILDDVLVQIVRGNDKDLRDYVINKLDNDFMKICNYILSFIRTIMNLDLDKKIEPIKRFLLSIKELIKYSFNDIYKLNINLIILLLTVLLFSSSFLVPILLRNRLQEFRRQSP
jgi:hypothetical protein